MVNSVPLYLSRKGTTMNYFQLDRPIFVRIEFSARNKTWKVGDHLPWREMNLPQDKIQILFNNGFLIHSDESENLMQVGDGLEALDSEGLQQIVDDYNKRIKAVCTVDSHFLRRKCPSSRIATKQRGLIRSWRRNNLDWLEKAEANK